MGPGQGFAHFHCVGELRVGCARSTGGMPTLTAPYRSTVALGALYPKNRYELIVGMHAGFTNGWTGGVNASGSWGRTVTSTQAGSA